MNTKGKRSHGIRIISSLGDLFPERDLIKQVITELNDHPAYRDKFKLTPYLWEEQAPAMIGPSAQSVVNERMIMPDAVDVLIGMMWLRMGTPTKDLIDPDTQTEYLSGTYYEFMLAYRHYAKAGTPHILLYRCLRPPPQVEFDYEQAGRSARSSSASTGAISRDSSGSSAREMNSSRRCATI
jgi:hypothetical protein